jgi:uncharacterized protein YecE (DUF72 family)
MTQHPAEMSRVPKALRQMLPAAQRNERQLILPTPEMLGEIFGMFWSAMRPRRKANKLGMLAFQFPRYFIAKPPNFEYLASLPDRLPGASIAIEFRHPSWVCDSHRRAETMKFPRA